MAKIQEFSFKNVRSYGDNVTRIPFDMENGLVLILGENGFGKTSICEALEYGLYGKSSRVQAKSMPNLINDNMVTNVKFLTDDGRKVSVTRGLAPDFYDLVIDGETSIENKGKKSEALSSKARLDKLIENELYGIPFDIFANNILLSVNDFKSFVNMKTADKRKIIDKIFDTDIFNKMIKVAKEELKELKAELLKVSTEIDEKQKIYESTVARIDELKSQTDDDKDALILELKDKSHTLNMSIKSLISKKDSIVTEQINTLRDLDSNINEVKSKITEAYDNKSKKLEKLVSESDEKISNLKNELNKEKTEKLTKIESDYQVLISEIKTVEEETKELFLSAEKKLSEKQSKADDDKRDIIGKYDESIATLKKHYEFNADANAKSFDKEISIKDLEVSRFTELTNQYTEAVSEDKSRLSKCDSIELSLNEKLDLYNNHKCPKCGSDLEHDAFHIEQKQSVIDTLAKLKEKRASIEKQLKNDEGNVKFFGDKIKVSESERNDINIRKINCLNDLKSKYESDIANAEKEKSDKINEIDSEFNIVCEKINSIKSNALSQSELRYSSEISDFDKKRNIKIKLITDEYDQKISLGTSEILKELESLKESLNNDVNLSINEFSKREKELTDSKNNVSISFNSRISAINSELSSAQDAYQDACDKLNSLSTSDTTSVMNELNAMVSSIENELGLLKVKQTELSDLISVREDVSYVIGEDGLKKNIMRRILPAFNETINAITTLFDFKYRFVFDDEFNCHMSLFGQIVDITTSQGESKIMDIIVLLATLKLILMKHGSVNMLFLDEIFSNLDVKNIARAVSILKDYSKEYNLTIFVMSHTTVPQELFDEVINVKNNGIFSEIEIIK